MILDLLLNVFFLFLQFVLSPITNQADVQLDPNLANAFANVSGALGTMNEFFPVTTILAIFSILVVIEVAIFAYKAIMWVLKKIPGIK
jgi:hypothetical protein